MKKQLLILILAIFAVSQSFGQTPFDPPACEGDALHPAIGQQYAYTVTIPLGYTGYNGDGTFQWWVTQDVNLLAGAVEPNAIDFTASGTAAFVYNTPGVGEPTINVIWNGTAIGTGNYYLIVRYRETNTNATGTCGPDNIKVFLITPQNTFWLRIENVADATGADGGDEHCAPDVLGARIVDINDPGEVEYFYGNTDHYLKVSANGYTGNFDGLLRLPALPDGMGYGTITWTSTSNPIGGSFPFTTPATDTLGGVDLEAVLPSVNTYDPGDPTAVPPVPPSWGTGEEIIIHVPIHHNHNETLIDRSLTFAFDGSFTVGTTPEEVTYDDMSGGADGLQCITEAAFADAATTVLRARPGINAVTPAFVPDPSTETP